MTQPGDIGEGPLACEAVALEPVLAVYKNNKKNRESFGSEVLRYSEFLCPSGLVSDEGEYLVVKWHER